jgi:hypothetical protein
VFHVAPWIPVEPNKNGAAILGKLPLKPGAKVFRVPSTVVPSSAGGILIFAWARFAGPNPPLAYWHVGARLADGTENWFSLLVASGGDTVCNSQAFWLPMPADGTVVVRLYAAAPLSNCDGEVEIHGYYPGTVQP